MYKIDIDSSYIPQELLPLETYVNHIVGQISTSFVGTNIVFQLSLHKRKYLVLLIALKRLLVHRYSIVIFTFSGPLGLLGSDIWKQNTAEDGDRGHEGCCIFQYRFCNKVCHNTFYFYYYFKWYYNESYVSVSV